MQRIIRESSAGAFESSLDDAILTGCTIEMIAFGDGQWFAIVRE